MPKFVPPISDIFQLIPPAEVNPTEVIFPSCKKHTHIGCDNASIFLSQNIRISDLLIQSNQLYDFGFDSHFSFYYISSFMIFFIAKNYYSLWVKKGEKKFVQQVSEKPLIFSLLEI
jgi:hypothetical protein